MKQNPRNGFLILGIICFFVFGGNLLSRIFEPHDIWWTHENMKLKISDCSDQLAVFVKDQPLGDVLQNGQLMLKDGGNTIVLNESDIGFRINNWYKVRSSQIAFIAIDSALSFAGLIFLIYGIIPLVGKGRKDLSKSSQS
jgi:hypothetical protein